MPAATVSEEQDRWEAFAALPEDARRAHERPSRARRVLRRLLDGEILAAMLLSLAAAAAYTWPLALKIKEGVPSDLGDPMLQTYTLGWLSHAAGEGENLFDTNTLWPAQDSLLFSDTLLGYLPAALFARDQASAIVVYNVLFILAFALAAFGGYVLLRQLGARVAGSAVGAAVFAFAPWKISQFGHLQVLSCGAIALSLAMLARGHGWSLRHGFKPERQRPLWIILGWLTALWQFSIGAGLGVPFVYLLMILGLIALAGWSVKRHRLKWGTIAANVLGGAVFSFAVLWLADKHMAVSASRPEAERSWEYVRHFSPAWQSFIISPEDARYWGEAHAPAREALTWPPEQTLLVGFTAIALGLMGLVWSAWSRRIRLVLGLVLAALVALAMGPNFLDGGRWAWGLLYEYAPGFDAIRTPGRLVLYISLVLAILAAGTVTRLADRADRLAHDNRVDTRSAAKAPRRVHALLFLPLALIAVESAPVLEVHSPPVSPVAFSELEGPVLVLPAGGHDGVVQFWSLDGFPETANGITAFTPSEYSAVKTASLGFPEAESVEELRSLGVSTVLVVPSWLPGTEWASIDVDAPPLGVDVERVGGAAVYSLG
ncbi:hypothetical protein [Salininema proteolyticum]|uniref:Glycosyltransferase RgtA/B/C/D-like domain-containing protein n=1 Tax=Salininema proteolyticum TaxID=1607685 RepID=A0ABV8TTT1_9ACTN